MGPSSGRNALHNCNQWSASASARPLPRTDQQATASNRRDAREQRVHREAENGGAPPPPPPPPRRTPLAGNDVVGRLGEGGAAHRAAPRCRPAPPLRHLQLRQAAAQQRPRPHAPDGVISSPAPASAAPRLLLLLWPALAVCLIRSTEGVAIKF